MLRAFTFILIAYAVAFCAAYFFISDFNVGGTILWKTFYADVIATAVIFIFSIAFKNSSFYDPYWSVAPIVIALFWNSVSEQKFSFRNDLIIVAFFIWGLRLTLNWARGWKGLHHEDWRYGQLRSQTGMFYPVVNFLGIHLFPTIMVFIAMIPAYYSMVGTNGMKLNFLDGIAIIICLSATMIELIADEQQRAFKRNRLDEKTFCKTGLWKFSRHPNYFGEVFFWWGIYLFAVAANPSYWWTISGAATMTLMFVFISIPMMEKHMMEKRPDYHQYQKEVVALVPWFGKK